MNSKEYMNITGLTSKKTVYWIHNQVHGIGSNRDSNGNRIYDEDDLEYYNSRKLENFSDGRIVQIPNCSSYYISDNGDVYLFKRGFLEKLTGFINFGYHLVGITDDFGVRRNVRVHRLVALAFIDNPLNKPYVNHIDGNKLNNHYTNLEWCTDSENMHHAFDNGLCVNDKAFNDSQSIQVIFIDSNAIFHLYGSISSASRLLNVDKTTIIRQSNHSKRILNNGFPIELLCNTFIYYDDIKGKCNEYQRVITEYEL